MSKHIALPEPALTADFTLKQLQGDCARMVPHWTPAREATPGPVSPSRIHGVVVPPTSARIVDGMNDFGN
ncbi:hypothetical protein [Streptomyces sp. NBC_01304]|uniref:hypothetical protein n=1 Tax=Streptomyces sp. NBC_01304 TaxID=2903818 RepID=UPI002E0DE196|nr:hypothetical protein OG430_35065 [Streptomyces sp. NBC_01304]